MSEKKTHVAKDSELLELIFEIKKHYPETKGLTASGVIDWALRYLLTLKKSGVSPETQGGKVKSC